MEDVNSWTHSQMSDLLRDISDPHIIKDMTNYLLSISNPESAKKELHEILGVESQDTSQAAFILRAKKLNFIEEFISKKFGVKPKSKKKKGVKIEVNKKNLASLRKGLNAPAFTSKEKCYCMATEHELVGNCLACGKIVCAKEGRGPCMFCGHIVLPKGEVPPTIPDTETYTQAISHKNKLLNFDRTSEERLGIIDDQTDWFEIAENTWLSPEDREKARQLGEQQKKRQQQASSQIRVQVDLSSGGVSADIGNQQYIAEDTKKSKEDAAKFFTSASRNLQPDDLSGRAKAIYEHVMAKLKQEVPKEKPLQPKHSVIQHEDPFENLEFSVKKPKMHEPLVFKESDDKRHCLTMHQPWASLVIEGFKRVEGRNWSTEHRGPLWIHASARRPTEEEVKEVQDMYSEFYGNERPEFPNRYPTGVLLGRVEMVDCMTHEEYLEAWPEEDLREPNESRFVMIFKNPKRLILPIKMQGSKKIFNLEFDLWEGAKRGLRRVYTGWWPPEKETEAELYY